MPSVVMLKVVAPREELGHASFDHFIFFWKVCNLTSEEQTETDKGIDDAKTFGTTTLGLTPFSLTIVSTKTLSITTLNISTPCITTITTTLSSTRTKCDTRHNIMLIVVVMSSAVILNVIRGSVVAPHRGS
jgi:hypothetical protein